MKTAELLSGTDGAYLFHYFTKDEFKTLTIYVSEYQSGTLISKSKVADLDYDGIDSPSRGVIAVVPDFESFKVKLIVADDYAKYSTDFPILGQYLYLLENVDFTLFFAIYLLIYSIFTPNLSQYFQFGYFFFFLFF